MMSYFPSCIMGSDAGAIPVFSRKSAICITFLFLFTTAVFSQAAAETVAYTFKFNWDGSLLAAADQKDNINVYNIPGKKIKHSFYKGGIPAFLDFSTDNRYLACGYHSGSDPRWYKNNNRVKKLTIEADGQTYQAEFRDTMELQIFHFPHPVKFNRIIFRLKDVYLSGVDNDTAIAEVQFYYRGAEIELDLYHVQEFPEKVTAEEAAAH